MLKILSLALLLGSAGDRDVSYNYFMEVEATGDYFAVSKALERVEGKEYGGERFFMRAGIPKVKFGFVQFEHYRRQSRDIEFEALRFYYALVGYEYLIQPEENDISQNKHLLWFGYVLNRWGTIADISYSTDFTGFYRAALNVKTGIIKYRDMTFFPKLDWNRVGDKKWWKIYLTGEYKFRGEK